MAGFKTHVTTSTVLGIGYGAAAHLAYGMPLDKSLLAAGLCGVSGMLPDLDSDSGKPVREMFAFGAAVIPMLMIDRFRHLGMSHESMVLAGGVIYLVIRFGISKLFKLYTVHRGMWHSVPAAGVAGLLAFLICSCESLDERLFKTGAVVLGFLSHLVLDEIYSFTWDGLLPRRKKSAGTAFKFWNRSSMWSNVSTYGKLVVLAALAFGDPILMDRVDKLEHAEKKESETLRVARDWLEDVFSSGNNLKR